MAGEQDIGKGSDQVKFNRRDQTGETMGNESDLSYQRLDNQQRHQEMEKSGLTFQGMNKLYQQDQVITGDKVDDGTGAPNDESVTIGALDPDGNEIKASGKTGLTESELELAWRPGQLEPVKPQPESPPIGQRVSVENLLGMVSPIGPARQKSETLKNLLGEMRKHPWKVGVIFEPNPKNPEYDPNPKQNTIHIDSTFSKQKQVETFGHELYHATHQNLDDLYGGKSPVSLDRYKQIKMDQEAGAFLREFKINRELGHTEKPAYNYADGNDVKPKYIEDLVVYKQPGVIDETRSKEAIAKFLSGHPAAVYENGHVKRNFWGQIETESYPQKHENDYWKNYKLNFETNHRSLAERDMLGKGY